MGLSERVNGSAALEHAAPDALTLLTDEHRQITMLFDEFEGADTDIMRKTAVVDRICKSLRLHARVEEEIFYPSIREAVQPDGELIEDTGTEHASIKVLVTRLEQSGPADEHYDALVRVLADYVKYHFEEEEQQLFPQLRCAQIDLMGIGTQIFLRRNDLQSSSA